MNIHDIASLFFGGRNLESLDDIIRSPRYGMTFELLNPLNREPHGQKNASLVLKGVRLQ